MQPWRDRFNQLSGKTRFAVCRLFLHLAGKEAAVVLGILNGAARQAVDSDGDLQVLGEGLAEICQTLLQYDTYWRSASNEGDAFWQEAEAADYLDSLFTDSAQRYEGGSDLEEPPEAEDELLSVPVTSNLVVMLTVAYEGEEPSLETDLADMTALKTALKTLINLHYQERLRAVQVHFSPAQLGDELTYDQLLLSFPELLPL